jgi:transposase InsO family protein
MPPLGPPRGCWNESPSTSKCVLARAIERHCKSSCSVCNRIAPSQPAEPLKPSPAPTYPFKLTVADYFTLKGFVYLVYADGYTGWVTVVKCPPHGADAGNLKRELCTLFCVYGAPVELATDGGQPFASHGVQQFLQDWGVKWRLSSAYYPQSNGRAELAVKREPRNASSKKTLLQTVISIQTMLSELFYSIIGHL